MKKTVFLFILTIVFILNVENQVIGSEVIYQVNSTEFIVTSIEEEGVTGFTITPEFRWYLKKCENQLLEGFYASLYLRFARYNTEANFIHYPDVSAPIDYKAKMEVGEYGIGLQLGYQLVLWERFNR